MKVICVGALFQLLFRHFLIGGIKVAVARRGRLRDTVNQHTPAHHPVDACYYSVVDEPQLS